MAEQIAHCANSQKNEDQAIRVIFVSRLLLFDHAVSASDRIGDRRSPSDPQSSSSKTCDWRVLCPQIGIGILTGAIRLLALLSQFCRPEFATLQYPAGNERHNHDRGSMSEVFLPEKQYGKDSNSTQGDQQQRLQISFSAFFQQ